MKVLGIGNAIVDVICKVEDSFLSKNNLTKSTMKLVDETEFKKLLSNLKIERNHSRRFSCKFCCWFITIRKYGFLYWKSK